MARPPTTESIFRLNRDMDTEKLPEELKKFGEDANESRHIDMADYIETVGLLLKDMQESIRRPWWKKLLGLR